MRNGRVRVFLLRRRAVAAVGALVLAGAIFWAVSYPAGTPASAVQRQLPIYSVEREQKMCSVSFDAAWGNEDTQALIDILARYNVKATFFCVGDWAEKYPESVKALHDAGHEVMSHSNHHDHYNALTAQQIVEDVTASNRRIAAATGVTPTLIRCPYGEYDDHVISAIRSIGMEPDTLSYREKWLLIIRMLPLVENNFNLCELGPRSTGKSHLYKEISPNSILVSGGQTTVANLFYNMGRKTVGLVGLWDCVAFDEVAGIKFKDKDGVQIMKDYMASGSFARGKEEKAASASMVFVGNINQSVDVLLKTSSLFDPFPPEMGTDTAFLDRIHCYLPGWEIPKFRPEHFTDDYGFITDYLAEFIRELRKEQYGDALDKYFRLGSNLNQRDTIAVRRMVDGLVKLVYPDGEFTKEQLEEILKLALEMRRRVKEQLKKLGGMEFYDVNFSYIDKESFEESYVSVPEQGGGKLIPEGMCNPGQIYTVSQGKSGMIGVFRLESQMLPGNGKFERTGLGSDREAKEATNTAFNFLKANAGHISGTISTTTKDYIVNYQDLQGIGITTRLALPTLIALASIALNKPTVSSLAVMGEISIAGTMMKVDELANALQVCLDSGAKKVLLPIASAADLGLVPSDLIGCFNLIFYQSAEDAVFKALGVE